MADLLASENCSKCGEPLLPGQSAVLTATVKLTKPKYLKPGQLNFNFYGGSDRALQHLECTLK